VQGIRSRLEQLAEKNLNGREIRNAISTARQLAMFQGNKPMGYEHLQRVIDEQKKFEDYIFELNEEFTADEISKDLKER
jgi:hypothetical protein